MAPHSKQDCSQARDLAPSWIQLPASAKSRMMVLQSKTGHFTCSLVEVDYRWRPALRAKTDAGIAGPQDLSFTTLRPRFPDAKLDN
jgi:hypothetical protein